VTARGNDRRSIFRSSTDRRRFLFKLAALAELHHVEVYAFVQMTNHYHLVVCTPRASLCAFMQQFQTSYPVYFNRRYGRVGHLFAGRYKAKLVEGGHYLLRLSRYVHLNPVKTKEMRELSPAVRRERLHRYRWSSFPDYAGLCPVRDWMIYKALEAFSAQESQAASRRRYLQFVEEGLGQDDEAFLETLGRSSKAFGGQTFCRSIEDRFRDRTVSLHRYVDISMRRRESPVPVRAVIEKVLAVYETEESELFRRGNREAKDMWMRLAHGESGLTQRQIGALIGHTDGAAVSRRLALLASRMTESPALDRKYTELRATLTNRKA